MNLNKSFSPKGKKNTSIIALESLDLGNSSRHLTTSPHGPLHSGAFNRIT